MTKEENCLYQLVKNILLEHEYTEKISHTMQTVQCVKSINTQLRRTYPEGILIAETPNSSTSRITQLTGELYEHVIQRLLKWILRDEVHKIIRGIPFRGADSFAFDNPPWVVRNIIPTYIRNYQN